MHILLLCLLNITKGIKMSAQFDRTVEELALRYHGLLGQNGFIENAIYAMGYHQLPFEAKRTIELIL